jgi:hypothetical protein
MGEVNKEEIQAVLLPDSPCAANDHGPHGQIADGLLSMIIAGNEAMTIAIEGDWGSGKSTVIETLRNKVSPNREGIVKLLKEKAEANTGWGCHNESEERDKKIKELKEPGEPYSNCRVCVFDAWLHSGDPVRRAFLTVLVDSLEPNEGFGTWLPPEEHDKLLWIKQEKDALENRGLGKAIGWQTILGNFSQKRDVKETSTTLTLASWLFIIAALGIGLEKFALVGDQFKSPSELAFLLVAVSFVCWKLFERKWIRYHFGGLTGRHRSIELTTGSQSGNPSVTEFQTFFTAVLKRALSGGEENEKRKLILVLDNLDRVSESEAEEIWALVRIFVDNPQLGEWKKRLWVLVPIYPAKLDSGAGIEKTDEPQAPTRAPNFFDKVFQAKVRVPRPTHASNNEFLEKSLKRAFPELALQTDKSLENVRSIFEALGTSKADFGGGGAVPRVIIRFINDLVTLHHLWATKEFTCKENSTFQSLANSLKDKKIRLSYFALYLMNSKRDDFEKLLADGTLVDRTQLGLIDSSVKTESGEIDERPLVTALAAIHFSQPDLDVTDSQVGTLFNVAAAFNGALQTSFINMLADWKKIENAAKVRTAIESVLDAITTYEQDDPLVKQLIQSLKIRKRSSFVQVRGRFDSPDAKLIDVRIPKNGNIIGAYICCKNIISDPDFINLLPENRFHQIEQVRDFLRKQINDEKGIGSQIEVANNFILELTSKSIAKFENDNNPDSNDKVLRDKITRKSIYELAGECVGSYIAQEKGLSQLYDDLVDDETPGNVDSMSAGQGYFVSRALIEAIECDKFEKVTDFLLVFCNAIDAQVKEIGDRAPSGIGVYVFGSKCKVTGRLAGKTIDDLKIGDRTISNEAKFSLKEVLNSNPP